MLKKVRLKIAVSPLNFSEANLSVQCDVDQVVEYTCLSPAGVYSGISPPLLYSALAEGG